MLQGASKFAHARRAPVRAASPRAPPAPTPTPPHQHAAQVDVRHTQRQPAYLRVFLELKEGDPTAAAAAAAGGVRRASLPPASTPPRLPLLPGGCGQGSDATAEAVAAAAATAAAAARYEGALREREARLQALASALRERENQIEEMLGTLGALRAE